MHLGSALSRKGSCTESMPWPDEKLLQKSIRRNRGCLLLILRTDDPEKYDHKTKRRSGAAVDFVPIGMGKRWAWRYDMCTPGKYPEAGWLIQQREGLLVIP